MNIKEKIEELANKIKNDEALQAQFKEDPVKAVEGLLGVDLPEDTVKQIADGVKAKVSLDGVAGKLKNLL